MTSVTTERHGNGNGNGAVLRWLLGAVFTVALLLSGWISTANTGVATKQSIDIAELQRAGSAHEARVAVLEEQVRTLRAQLDRIETKLDKALGR